jgi:urease accessory protein
MHPIKLIRPAVAAGLALAAGSAAAHTGEHTVAGFASGFSHPFGGLDHLLAMIAVGLWAVQQGGRALWAVPAAFVLAMLGGGALAGWGVVLPHVETGIALSVLVLGLVVAARRHAPLAVGVAVAGGFALFHGHAHGLEMPQAAAPALYGLGFVLATSALHAAGIAAAWFGPRAVRVAGAGIAATGAALLWLA